MSSLRSTPVTNASRWPWTRLALVVAPALLSLLALGGVTAPRAVSINVLRSAVESARVRAELARREHALRRQYEEQCVESRAREALDAARSHTPQEIDPIVAQGFVRVACERADVEIAALAVGGERDSQAAVSTDRVVVRLVDLNGSASPTALLQLLDELDALGAPACVLQLNLDASAAAASRVDFSLQLGLFHFAPPVVEAATAEPSSTPESP